MLPLTVDPHAGVEVDAVLEALAAYGLDASPRALPEAPLSDAQWPRLLEAVASERLAGLLGAAIAEGAMPVTVDQRAAAAALQADVAVAALLLERLLIDVAERFDANGIALRVLKGPSVAHVDYPDPALRCFGDLDLLVPGGDFDRAIALLVAHGGRRAVPELRRGFDRRFGKGATVAMPNDLEVDLHRTLATGPLAMTITPEDLFATSTPFVVGGRTLLGLGTEERFVHACVHAGLAPETQRYSLRDVVQIAQCSSLSLDRVVALGRAWQARAAVARAVNLAWASFGLPASELSLWARDYRPEAIETRRLDAYLGGDKSYTRRAVATLGVIPRRRDKVAFARSVLFPGREYLDARRVRLVDHVRRGTAHLRGGRAR